MGNVERIGLLALFVLCALIVGVGIFGSDGTNVPRFEQAKIGGDVRPVPRDSVWKEQNNQVPEIANANLRPDGLRPVRRQDREIHSRARSDIAPAEDRKASFEEIDLNPSTDIENRKTPVQPQPKAEPKVAAMREHTPVKGESWWSLAKKFYGKPSQANIRLLQRANPKYKSGPREGRTVRIPALPDAPVQKREGIAATPKGMRRYVPKKGESFWVIARDQLGSVSPKTIELLRAANPQIRGDNIRAGKPINLPTLASAR